LSELYIVKIIATMKIAATAQLVEHTILILLDVIYILMI